MEREGEIKMNKKEIESVIRLDANKRYEYFIKKVVDMEEVWGLFNDGWATSDNGKGEKFIPFWPSKEFAELCAIEEWEGYIPEAIELDEFVEEWLIGMEEDEYKISIFSNNKDAITLEIDILTKDLNEEISKYE